MFLIIILTGCKKKINEDVTTVIEENKNIIVGINYPATGYKKIDNLIENDVQKIYDDFKDDYESFSNLTTKSELNIDYTYNKLDNNIITITLSTYINSSKLKNKINYIKTYNYDINKQKILSLNDLVDENNIKKIPKLINNYLIKNYKEFFSIDDLNNIKYDYSLFSIDNDYLYIYFR